MLQVDLLFDPELMLRILLIGYVYGIRSERQLCSEVHLNLAYRWFIPPSLRIGMGGFVKVVFIGCCSRTLLGSAVVQDW